MRLAHGVLAASLVALGCQTVRERRPQMIERWGATRQLARASALVREGEFEAARDLYQQVARDHGPDTETAEALYQLGLLHVDPKSPLRDYQVARATFERLLSKHSKSPRVPEARAWRAALVELQKREGDAAKLRTDLERLKELDLQLEGPR